MLEIYVISLERSDRWPAQQAMLDRLGLSATRWPAIDGRAKALSDLEKYWIKEGVLQRDSDIMKCQDRDERYKQSVIGLMASTALLWRHLIDQPQEWSLILEDDCDLHPALADQRYFEALWSFLPQDAEFVYFGTQIRDHFSITEFADDVNPFFVRMRRCTFGAYAYAVRKSLLPTLMSKIPFSSAIDNFDPNEYAIYTIKNSCDWWNKLKYHQDGRTFYGVAAPRPGKSTITD